MKKKMLKVLSSVLVSCGLFVIPVNAGTWKPDQGYNCWSYVKDDGTLATGWNYIDGNWYYFNEQIDNENFKNYCYLNHNCSWDNELGSYIGAKGECINNKTYFFDSNGHMLHDCYIIEENGDFKCLLNKDGISDDKTWGDEYSGYDLSQACNNKSVVPNVVGLTETTASEKLLSVGFSVNSNTMPVTDKEQNGIVIWQSVESGETITTGKTITLTIGEYIEPKKENISGNIIRNDTNRSSTVYP